MAPRRWILLLVFLNTQVATQTLAQTGRISNYFMLDGALFGLGTEEFNMAKSREKCKSLNGSLATFDTQIDYMAAVKYLTDTTVVAEKGVWIDFKANLTYQKFFYWNNEPFRDGVWATEEPSEECLANANPDLCCARMQWLSSSKYDGLRDDKCSKSYLYLCRLPLTNCSNGLKYHKEDNSCVDVDECSLGYCREVCTSAYCTCVNSYGSFECRCLKGYTKNEHWCDAIDGCVGRNCTEVCEITTYGYRCECSLSSGLVPSKVEYCRDLNECSSDKNPCPANCYGGQCPSVCFNTPGNFTCECPVGFSKVYNTCRDIDECQGAHNCSQQCNNTIGGFQCSCYHGYRVRVGFPSLCDDVNECVDQPLLCDQNCTNTNGSYHCSCRNGYYLDKTDRSTCHDINECENSTICGHNCTNTNGSYYCTCSTGYQLDEKDKKSCHDINECVNTSNDCRKMCYNQTVCPYMCLNTNGSYTCECAPGFNKTNGTCLDVDECEGTNNCSQRCNNTVGGYTCYCDQGYSPTGASLTQCDDINECLDDHHDCDHNCTNTNGSYYCTCRTGYHLNTTDNTTCHDINECDNTTLCQHRCHNTPGSYYCACPDGFQTSSDGKTCIRQTTPYVCPCRSPTSNTTLTYAKTQAKAEEIKKELSVETHQLSSFIGKKTCAEDQRASAQQVGYIGVVLIMTVTVLVIVPDAINFGNFIIVKLRKCFKTNK